MEDIPSMKREESMEVFSNTLNENVKQILQEEDTMEITASQLLKALVI